MERQKELFKLINVLRRTSRMALQSEWTGGKEDAATYCLISTTACLLVSRS